MKKQAKQAPKKTAITQAVAASNKAKKETQKKSKAARQGWATRRAKDFEANEAHHFINVNRPATFAERTLKAETLLYSDYKTPSVDSKPVGTITGLAEKNEETALRLGANIGSLLSRLRTKLVGETHYGQTAGSDDTKEYSNSAVISAQQRTQENLEAALKMIEEMDNLQEVNL